MLQYSSSSTTPGCSRYVSLVRLQPAANECSQLPWMRSDMNVRRSNALAGSGDAARCAGGDSAFGDVAVGAASLGDEDVCSAPSKASALVVCSAASTSGPASSWAQDDSAASCRWAARATAGSSLCCCSNTGSLDDTSRGRSMSLLSTRCSSSAAATEPELTTCKQRHMTCHSSSDAARLRTQTAAPAGLQDRRLRVTRASLASEGMG